MFSLPVNPKDVYCWDEPWGFVRDGKTLNIKHCATVEHIVEYVKRVDDRFLNHSDEDCLMEFISIHWAYKT